MAKLRSGASDKPCRDQDHSGRSLFNTPARLKYLKSQRAELSHIVDILNRLSLAHPGAFTLINDGKEMAKTAGTGNLRQAIAGVYGLASAKKMVAIENRDPGF